MVHPPASAAADRRQEGQFVPVGQRRVGRGEGLVDRHPQLLRQLPSLAGWGGRQPQVAPQRAGGGPGWDLQLSLAPPRGLPQAREQPHADLQVGAATIGFGRRAGERRLGRIGVWEVHHGPQAGSNADSAAHNGASPRRPCVSLAIALLTISDTRTAADDRSGDALAERLQAAGHRLHERRIVPDDRYRIRAAVSHWIADPAVAVVISSGGTGLTGRDGTPEAVAPLLDKTIEGFGELFRVLSFETIGTSTLQSRALAGVANGTLIFVLPGSLDAVQTAWDRLIGAQLDAETRPCNLVQLLPRLREGTASGQSG